VTALAVLAFLASGEDANFGIYSGHIRKASMTDRSSDVFYLNTGNTLAASTAPVSIATLAYAVARRKDLAEFKATLDYLKQRIAEPSGPYGEYTL
jgi:hypothetical protein